MEFERIKYNNLTMVLYILIDVLKNCAKMDMMKMTILIAMLQDEAIVDLLTVKDENLSFANFRMLNKSMMANINKRFYHTLPLMVNASSILLDAGFMEIRDGEFLLAGDESNNMFLELDNVSSQAAQRVDRVLSKMLHICKDYNAKRLIKMLNIEI